VRVTAGRVGVGVGVRQQLRDRLVEATGADWIFLWFSSTATIAGETTTSRGEAVRATLMALLSTSTAAVVSFAGLDQPAAQSGKAERKIALAKCLTDKGATFYGASWCPVCLRQRRAFGPGFEYLSYVECSSSGGRGNRTSICEERGIQRYPTWTFADGSRQTGLQTLQGLAKKTGCGVKKPK
jgi:hypothetical protein